MKENKKYLMYGAIFLPLAGFGCLFLPMELSWIAGFLFFLSGALWAYCLWHYRLRGTGKFDRELSRGWWSQLSLLFGTVIIVFMIGVGLLLLFPHKYECSYGKDFTTGYDQFLYIAHRFLGYNYYGDGDVTNSFIFLFSLFGTALVGGILITTLSNIVQQRKEDIEQGAAEYKFKDHIVIIGFGNYAVHLTKNALQKDKDAIVVLMTNQNILRVRSMLRVELPEASMERLFLIAGEMTSGSDIKERLSIPAAKEVYILGEAKEFGVDSKCVECVKYISDARKSADDAKEGKPILPVYVHLQHLYSNRYIKSADTPSLIQEADNVFLRPFCFYENWGRLMWGYYALPRYAPLDFKPMVKNTHVHLVVVGLNRMGAALVLQAARICHYPNFTGEANKTVISVIERNPDVVEEFRSMYPGLFKLEDVSVVFEQKEGGKLHTYESFSSEIDRLAKDPDTLLTIAICYRDPDEALSAALRLPESIYYQPHLVKKGDGGIQNDMLTQVLIRQEMDYGLGHNIDTDKTHYKNFHIFGMFNEGINLNLLDDTLPMLAKFNYVQMGDGTFVEQALGIINGTKESREKDLSKIREGWRLSKEWDRMSNRCQIDIFRTYLELLEAKGLLRKKKDSEEWDLDDYITNGFYRLFDAVLRPDKAPAYDPDLAIGIAEVEHRRWNAERLIAGWRAAGKGEPRLDAFYIHPNIVPYKELDDNTKVKDIIVLRAAPFFDAIRKKTELPQDSDKYMITIHPK